jgi:hypothetical protein
VPKTPKTSRPLPAALAKRAALAGERKLRALAKAARDDIALIKRRRDDIEDAFYDIVRREAGGRPMT